MGKVKQIKIKNRTYCFYNDIINIEEFNSSILKIDKKSYRGIDIYYIRYITIKKIGDCGNMYSVNPLYLIIGKVDGYIEKNFVDCNSAECNFDSTDENKEILKNTTNSGMGLKMKLKQQTAVKKGEYDKDIMKIKLDTDDNLPLSKPLNLHLLTVIVSCIFEEDGKFYPQLYLEDCLHELRVASNI